MQPKAARQPFSREGSSQTGTLLVEMSVSLLLYYTVLSGACMSTTDECDASQKTG